MWGFRDVGVKDLLVTSGAHSCMGYTSNLRSTYYQAVGNWGVR